MAVLTSEQIDLLHHVELSEAGWQDRLWEQLVIAAVLKIGGASDDSLVREVLASVGTSGDGEPAQRAIQRLLTKKTLISTGGRIVASQAALAEAQDGARRATTIEEEAETAYSAILNQEAPACSEKYGWKWFVPTCLEPLVLGLGAKTYELLTSVDMADGAAEKFVRYLENVSDDEKKQVRRTVERFFSTPSVQVRAYVLRFVHANLMSAAARLPKKSLDSLQSRMRSTITLKILLDTNFLFSILGLHENPSNEAAGDLMRLIEQVSARVKVASTSRL